MATTSRIFALDFDRGKVFGSSTIETPYEWRKFKSGDIERFRVYNVTPDPSAGSGRLTSTSTTGLTLKAALGSISGNTVYTSVTLTPNSTGAYFEGALALNVSGVTDLFTSSKADRSANIEFELTESSEPRSLDFEVTIRHSIITTALQDTPAPDTAIGSIYAHANFVPFSNTSTTAPFQMVVNDFNNPSQLYLLRVIDGTLGLTPL